MTGIHRHMHGIQASGDHPKKAVADYNYTFSSNVNNTNLATVLTTDGWDGTTPKVFNITINSGVRLGATSTGAYGLYIPNSFPAFSIINIDNNGGTINGEGGAGGYQAGGGGGGTAVYCVSVTVPINFDNAGSTIYAGGGGGGGGGNRVNCPTNCSGGKTPSCLNLTSINGGAGGKGYGNSSNVGGSGGSSSGANCAACSGGAGGTAGTGGTGGGQASTGSTGGNGSGCADSTGPWGGGGAGNAVNGDSLINWVATGTITGTQTG